MRVEVGRFRFENRKKCRGCVEFWIVCFVNHKESTGLVQVRRIRFDHGGACKSAEIPFKLHKSVLEACRSAQSLF